MDNDKLKGEKTEELSFKQQNLWDDLNNNKDFVEEEAKFLEDNIDNDFFEPELDLNEVLNEGPYVESWGGQIIHYDDVEDPDEIDDPVGYWNYVTGGPER